MLRNTYRHNLDNGMCVFFVYIIICVVMYWGIFNVANFYRLNNIFFYDIADFINFMLIAL